MEFLGHQKSLLFLLTTGIIIKKYITDRHTKIIKWMKEDCPKICKEMGKSQIDHLFDLWHIAKSRCLRKKVWNKLFKCRECTVNTKTVYVAVLEIKKVLLKLSKERGCEIIGRWRKACVSHFYWAVISSSEHLGILKLAKFHSFLYHVLNKHKKFPTKVFDKCYHGATATKRMWMLKGIK